MVRAKKHYGQHWLQDSRSIQLMMNAAQLDANDLVLEVGPGTGELTRELAKTVKRVVAIELDRESINYLQIQNLPENVRLIEGDILEFDLSNIPTYKVVANIPYYITAKLIRLFLDNENHPQSMTLLVQKEVAERLTAEPGAMSVLAIAAQMYADVTAKDVITADKFTPPPKVDSQIVHFSVLDHPRANVSSKKFFALIKAGFGERRKKLANALAGGLQITKPEAELLLEEAGVGKNVRAQELSIGEWEKLYNKLYN